MLRPIILCLQILWPLYYSAKKFNNCEEEDMRRVVKYWCILVFEYLLEKLLSLIVYEMILNIIILVIVVVMVVNDFKYSEIIYDNTLLLQLERNKKGLETLSAKLEGSVMVYYNSVMHKINRDFLDRIIPSIKNIFLGELIKATPVDPNAPKGIDIAKKSANSAKERHEKVLEKLEQNSK